MLEHSLLTQQEIGALIPHCGPMCLLEAITEHNAESLTAVIYNHREASNPLCHQGKLYATCALEYAAQASALHTALYPLDKRLDRERVTSQSVSDIASNVGLLVQAKNIIIQHARLDHINEPLVLDVSCLFRDEKHAMYSFTICSLEKSVVEGRLSIMGKSK